MTTATTPGRALDFDVSILRIFACEWSAYRNFTWAMPVKLRSAVYRPVPVTFSLPSCRTNPAGAVSTVATGTPPSSAAES